MCLWNGWWRGEDGHGASTTSVRSRDESYVEADGKPEETTVSGLPSINERLCKLCLNPYNHIIQLLCDFVKWPCSHWLWHCNLSIFFLLLLLLLLLLFCHTVIHQVNFPGQTSKRIRQAVGRRQFHSGSGVNIGLMMPNKCLARRQQPNQTVHTRFQWCCLHYKIEIFRIPTVLDHQKLQIRFGSVWVKLWFQFGWRLL